MNSENKPLSFGRGLTTAEHLALALFLRVQRDMVMGDDLTQPEESQTAEEQWEFLKAAYQAATVIFAKDNPEVRIPAHHLLEYAELLWRSEQITESEETH